jgi:hypothetical protein
MQVRKLVQRGVSLNTLDCYGYTALHHAVQSCDLQTVLICLPRHSPIGECTAIAHTASDTHSALHIAAKLGLTRIAHAIIDYADWMVRFVHSCMHDHADWSMHDRADWVHTPCSDCIPPPPCSNGTPAIDKQAPGALHAELAVWSSRVLRRSYMHDTHACASRAAGGDAHHGAMGALRADQCAHQRRQDSSRARDHRRRPADRQPPLPLRLHAPGPAGPRGPQHSRALGRCAAPVATHAPAEQALCGELPHACRPHAQDGSARASRVPGQSIHAGSAHACRVEACCRVCSSC